MRRTAIPGLLLVLLILTGCSYYRAQSTCGGNNQAPIVCIDSTGHATPDPVHVKRGQWVHFFQSSGDLDIRADFLDNQGHDGNQAWGRIKKDATLGRHHYQVLNLSTGKTYDPDVMIDPSS
jgi:hypothetical protein